MKKSNPKAENKRRFLKQKEVCELLGISLSTLNRWNKKNYLPYSQVGGICFYDREKINEVLTANYSGR